jgi:outer membrane protein OmpA-like peptidoglycan-associated protein
VTSLRIVIAAALAAASVSCAGTELRERASVTDRIIASARDNGAMRCAPVELAMAESHNDFARQELSEGNYHQAVREVEIAEAQAKAALDKSPRDRCNPDDAPPAGPGDADGDKILDNVDECPRKPEDHDGYQDTDGCPEEDNDSDGIADAIDDCPLEPEDRDGNADTDGCPDPDNDKDGIADTIDQCPDEAEDVDGVEDDDGCPDCDNDKDGVLECPQPIDKCPAEAAQTPDGCPPKYQLIVVTETKIELKQTVYFDTRKATIKRVSFPLLDEVALALEDNATIQVRIEGHTDSQGADRSNLKLSKKRAQSVRSYLVGKGVDPSRMVAEGYGESVPIADNRTAGGRAQNRRVEFVITAR